VLTALFSSGVIDGLDGLAGGVMSIIFAAYSAIAFFQNQINLAALCAAIAGGTLAFLWFNIPPARFYMSETGILGLTSTLTVIAFLTNSVAVLPIIAFPLTATVIANVIQISSKKLFKRKVFLVAPIHHHFEALGWPAYKVVMRYWIIGFITAVVGMVVFLISRV
jgi:phospho-N-acetylmuramoyl-pentapeptide-transferase